jgi:hypothetical protein
VASSGGDTGGFQTIDQPDRLRVFNIAVDSSMNRQNRRRQGAHPVERARPDVRGEGVIEIAAKELREDVSGVDAFSVGFGEIGCTVVIDHGGHAARLIEIRAIAFKFLHARCQAEKQCERTAGRSTRDANAAWVEIELGRVGAQPSDGRLDVVHLGRELKFGSKPVIHRRGDITALGELDAQSEVLSLFPARNPPPWMHRTAGCGAPGVVARTHDIDPAVRTRGVAEVGLEDHVVRHRRRRSLGGEGRDATQDQDGGSAREKHGQQFISFQILLASDRRAPRALKLNF